MIRAIIRARWAILLFPFILSSPASSAELRTEVVDRYSLCDTVSRCTWTEDVQRLSDRAAAYVQLQTRAPYVPILDPWHPQVVTLLKTPFRRVSETPRHRQVEQALYWVCFDFISE